MATTAHEGELQPWAALDGPVSHQLRRSLACLAHTDVFVRGFSEARQLVGWLHAAFGPHGCTGGSPDVVDTCTRRLTPPGQAFPPSHLHRNLSRCREDHYAATPYTSYCSEHDVTLSFEWKSFQFTPHDESFHARVRAAAAASPGRRVIAILSGGPHHFSKFKDHKHAMYFSLPDSFAIPQHWLQDFAASTDQLFRTFGTQTLPSNACVLWKTSNVGPRLGDGKGERPRTRHHPSARNGFHEWLNRWTTVMARGAHLPVLDLTDLTAHVVPRPNPKLVADGKVAPLAATDGHSHATEAAVEGDYYHGFNATLLLQPFVARTCQLCAHRAKVL